MTFGPSRSGSTELAVLTTRDRTEAIVVGDGPFLWTQRRQIAELAARHRLPTAYPYRDGPEAGGLLSYGTSIPAAWHRAAVYIDKILRGAKPADLPVEQPTTFELVINEKTAKALGLTITPSCWRGLTRSSINGWWNSHRGRRLRALFLRLPSTEPELRLPDRWLVTERDAVGHTGSTAATLYANEGNSTGRLSRRQVLEGGRGGRRDARRTVSPRSEGRQTSGS
jgi:hypothetical protein